MASVRTRFAPSPTGYLHIGGARTALFNFLFARHYGGTFILRIEDTDRERSTREAIRAIIDALEWLQLRWDEGPFYQTERFPLYRAKIEELRLKGMAYPCTCTPAELEAKRQAAQKEKRRPAYDGTCRPPEGQVPELPADKPFVIRFRSPREGTTVIEDQVKGIVTFDNRELDDLIIARSDGTPTYNFCVVVDDLDMAITHIIRGDDHLSNTPRQVQLYRAFGREPPVFAHVPLILGTDKARLSKRHGATSVTAYRDMGYLPEAVVNYLVRLAWSYGDQEIFTLDELIEKFTLENVGQSAGVFNPEKFLWVNFQHLKARPLGQLAAEVIPFLQKAGCPVPEDRAWLERVVGTLRERCKTLVELAEAARFYLVEEIAIDEKAAAKFLTAEIAAPLSALIERIEALEAFDERNIERAFGDVLGEFKLPMGKLAQPVRVALTGSTVSPGIYEVIAVLGKPRTVRRLRAALGRLQ